MTVLPGFEIESTDGIHVLCIYDADTDAAQLERFLGEFGIRETEPSSEPCSKDFAAILATVPSQGGIAVAAHAIGSKGLFQALQKNARALAWRNEHLLAIQIPSSIDELQEGPRAIVRNHAPEYQRAYMAGKQQAIAVVNREGCRPHRRPERPRRYDSDQVLPVGQGSRVFAKPFSTPDSRIRLNTDEQPEEHSELVAITWEGGGFLDGGAIHFTTRISMSSSGDGAPASPP